LEIAAKRLLIAIVLALGLPTAAHAACPPIPFVFAQGAPFNAPQVNTNFTALRDCINALALDPVTGPLTSTNNEIAVWDGTTGKILKNGLGVQIIHTAETPTITAEGSPLTSRNTTAFTAQEIFQAALLLAPDPAGGENYDSLRGVAFAPAATTINLVNGVSGYVVSDAATTGFGGFPATVALFGSGVARGNDAKVWGINTLLSDTMTGAVSAGTGKSLNNEFDFNVSSPNTTVLGLQLAGGAIVQPASAHGVVLQPLDLPNNGTVARWTAFLQSNAGATNTFAGIGPKAATGSSIKSQDIIFGFRTSVGADDNIILTGSEAGGLELFSTNALSRAISIIGGAGRFAVQDGGGFTIDEKIVMQGTGASLGFGANVAHTTQTYGNAASTTAILGAAIHMVTLPTSAGGGGLAVCVDAAGVLYKKAACP